jgi:hypothetical protein
MDRDSKLIFEGYITQKPLITEEVNLFIEENLPQLISEEDKEEWYYTAAKILDPTGVLSYGDLGRAFENYEKDQNLINFGLLLLAIFNATPNFGLLAAGIGGVGWAGVKALAKSAAKKPQLIEKAVIKLLELVKSVPLAKTGFTKTINSAVKRGSISKKVADDIMETFSTGTIPQRMLITTAQKGKGAVGSIKAKEASSLTRGLEKYSDDLASNLRLGQSTMQGLGRTAGTFSPYGQGSTYPSWAPKSILPQGDLGSMGNPVEVKFGEMSGTEGKDKSAYIGKVGYNPKTQKYYKVIE